MLHRSGSSAGVPRDPLELKLSRGAPVPRAARSSAGASSALPGPLPPLVAVGAAAAAPLGMLHPPEILHSSRKEPRDAAAAASSNKFF